MKTIEGGDSQTVIGQLIQEAEKDVNFSYRVKLNH